MFVDALRLDPQPVGLPQPNIHLVAKRPPVSWLRPGPGTRLGRVSPGRGLPEYPGAPRSEASCRSRSSAGSDEQHCIGQHRRPRPDIPNLTAPAHGSFRISVDVSSKAEYASYLCALYNASGEQRWQVPITAQQAENTVSLRVPTDKTANGTNELRILGIPSTGGSPVEVGRYRSTRQIWQ